MRRKNLVGDRYGKLLVICRDEQRDSFGRTLWICKCDCGNETRVITANLRFVSNGKPKQASCGCDQHAVRVHPYKYVLTDYRSAAKRYKRKFSLSEEAFFNLVTSDCGYCGKPPSLPLSPGRMKFLNASHGSFLYNGIDRIDSSKGYIEGNVVACCKTCNEIKSDKTHEEFLTAISAIYRHYVARGAQ